MKAKLIFSFVAALVISFAAYAQEPAADSVAEKVVVTTHDGIVRVGVIVSDDGEKYFLKRKTLGKFIYPRAMSKRSDPLPSRIVLT